MVLVHMTQVFLHGAYKYPRELTWVLGVFLLLCTLGMFFTGQVLRWDPDAYWGLAVGGSMAGRVPVIGPVGRPPAPGRPHHRRRLAEPLLHPARLRHPRRLAVLPGRPPLAGAQARHQRPARPRASRSIRRPTTRSTRRSSKTRRPLPRRRHAEGRLLLGPGRDRRGGRWPPSLGPEGADRPARPDAGRRQPAAGVAVPLAVRPAVAQPARRRRRSSSWSSRCS